jgi:hypothetical protein
MSPAGLCSADWGRGLAGFETLAHNRIRQGREITEIQPFQRPALQNS